jgi:hypothetical protein
MGTFPDALKRLIDRFNQQSDQIRSPDYNETLIRVDFINPLMTELGWDIENRQGFAERYREVVHEGGVRMARDSKQRMICGTHFPEHTGTRIQKMQTVCGRNFPPIKIQS